MRFFFDNCLAPPYARAVRALSAPDRHEVVHLGEKFARDTPDVEWINRLAAEGDWIIVSGDLRITRNPHEREAWLESGLLAFFFARGWMNVDFWAQAARLVHWWPKLVDQAQSVVPPAGFIVPFKGSRLEVVARARRG